ncbi:hypothetical protein B0H14DRAFT_3854876 [Mycena olivaceomarginata]|nr:hypothetical protein B0H14DRAFT_3854876 [Mycena olivaceomarginata]
MASSTSSVPIPINSLSSSEPAGKDSIDKVAPEVLGQIFEWACGDYFGPDKLYRKKSSSRLAFMMRFVITLVWQKWAEVAKGTGSLWSSRVMRPSDSPDIFEAWSETVKTSVLQFHVVLHGAKITKSLQQTSVGVDGIIAFVKVKASRCVMFNHPGCTDFLRAFTLGDFPSLERLIITNTSGIPSDREASHAFCGGSTTAPELRVAGFAYNWGQTVHFTELTTLALCSLPLDVAPSVVDLHAVLGEASRLEKLCIDDVESAGTANGLAVLDLHHLECLHYKPARNAPLGGLMSRLRGPRLQHVSLVVFSEDDIDILIGCRKLLYTAYSLTVDGFLFNEEKIRQLYDTMPGVAVLDASTGTPHREDLERLVGPDVRPNRLEFLGVHFTRYCLLTNDEENWVKDQVDEADMHLRSEHRLQI